MVNFYLLIYLTRIPNSPGTTSMYTFNLLLMYVKQEELLGDI